MITVLATREGLVGGLTASGVTITGRTPGVALPSTKALERFVRLVNPRNGRTAIALVYDVGPWNEHDDAYVFQVATRRGSGAVDPSAILRPGAERGVDERGRKTNGAAIDLSEPIWKALEMVDNAPVSWEFLE